MTAGRAAAVCGVVALLGCATGAPAYLQNRFDYWAFRARVGTLPEPNYLPWMMHRERLPDGGEALVACRWPDSAFPLRYHVSPPRISGELQDEFNPRDPQEYVQAVHRALERWQEVIGRPVRFVAVDDPVEATLRIHFDAAVRHEKPGTLLGMLRGEASRCRVLGSGLDHDHVGIEYRADEMWLFVSDPYGLLTPRQVEAVALHELGHVLGASGQHSPLRGDVMYREADDRRVEQLSEHDRNSFRALSRVRPGAVYARLAERHVPPVTEVRRTPPRLASELVDERFGFAVRFPQGWQVIRSPRGWAAVDGVSWDYDASLQVIALRGSVASYMERSARAGSQSGALRSREMLELDGQPLGRVVRQSGDRSDVVAVLDWKPGWILAVVSDCRTVDYPLYQPWFWSVVLSLERREPGSAVGSGGPP